MFKKINKMYSVLFGNESNMPCSLVSNSNRPIVESVSNLEYQVKEQGRVIEALMEYLSLETEWKGFSIGEGRLTVKKSK